MDAMSLIVITAVLIVLCIGLAVYNHRKRKIRENYDERQLLIRGNAYKAGFMTIMLLNAGFLLLMMCNEEFSRYAIGFISISFFGGLIVFAGYSIMKDAFFSFHQNRSSYLLLCLAVVVSQLVNFFTKENWSNVSLLMSSERILNLGCAAAFTVILVMLLIKRVFDDAEEE